MADARSATAAFLQAVESRDPDAVAACFTHDATYQNVPHPPRVGRAAVRALFAPILHRSQRVSWDIVSAAYHGDTAWLERVDRFWIDGREYAIECNGVFECAADAALLRAVRDYVDLGVWRERLRGAGLERGDA